MTSCTGMCDQGPALLANGARSPASRRERIDEMAHLIRRRVPVGDWPPEWFHVEDNIRRRDAAARPRPGAGPALPRRSTAGP